MKILAIYPWTHISSSALMVNGKLVAASPEERFTRVKWTTQFPIYSANWCLKQANLEWKDIDRIVVPWNPSLNINSASGRWDGNISWRGEMLSNVPSNVMKALNSVISSCFNENTLLGGLVSLLGYLVYRAVM